MDKKPFKLKANPRLITKPAVRQLSLVISVMMAVVVCGLFVYFNFSKEQAYGASNGDYRSITSGNWNAIATWQKYSAGAWTAATATPTSADGVITIQPGHTVTLTATVTADQIMVDTGATLTINATNYLYTNNGTGTDLTVNGTLTINSSAYLTQNGNSTIDVNGTVILSSGAVHSIGTGGKITINSGGRFRQDGGTTTTSSGKWTVSSGGVYQHNMNGGTIPLATWSAGSSCEITGVTSSLPGNFSQTFQDFKLNLSSLSTPLDLIASLGHITGNLTIVSTGSSFVYIDQQGNNNTIVIDGNMYMQGGTVYACINGATTVSIAGSYIQTGGTFAFNMAGGTNYGNTSTIMSVIGNATISGGTFDLSQCTANNSSKGNGILNLSGNLSLSGTGLMTVTSAQSRGQVYFNGTSVQYFTSASSVTNAVDFTVNSGAILRMDNQVLTGSGNFTLSSGGGLMIGNANGITSSGAAGNIQVTGTRSYSTGGDYTYNGSTAQNAGNGLPSTVHNLTVNNAADLTLQVSTSATNLITLTAGRIITGSNEIGTTNSATTSILGYSSSSYVVGNLRRSIIGTGVYDFPLGTLAYYELATLNLSSVTGISNILGSFTNSNPINALCPLTGLFEGLVPISDLLDYGYWTLTPNSPLLTGSYSITLNEKGFTNPAANNECYCVIKRANVLSAWQSLGTHVSSTATSSGVTAVRGGLTGFSNFGVGKSGGGALPIELISFIVKQNVNDVDIKWSTAAEKNNDYFTIERSADGRSFESLERIDGAGNSNTARNYHTTDTHPLAGKSYYRLKQTDYNGAFTYAPIRVINRNEKLIADKPPIEIKSIAPNPFKQRFSVTYNLETAGEVEVMFISMNGQIAHTEKLQAGSGINYYDYTDEKSIPTGNYIITLVSGGNKASKKILKTDN